MPRTRCATGRCSSCSTLPRARPRLPIPSLCAAPPSCKRRPTTPQFQAPSRRPKGSAPSRLASSKSGRCRIIWRDGASKRRRGGIFLYGRTMEKLPMTAGGYAALEAEFQRRQQVERARIVAANSEARSHGDLSENAEYHSAKEEQSHNEGRIIQLEDKLARADIIDISKLSGDTIKFGATVTLVDEDTEKKTVWQLVGEPEADAKKGRISITSPLARALLGKKKGAQVEVVTPGGAKAYEVMKVEWR